MLSPHAGDGVEHGVPAFGTCVGQAPMYLHGPVQAGGAFGRQLQLSPSGKMQDAAAVHVPLGVEGQPLAGSVHSGAGGLTFHSPVVSHTAGPPASPLVQTAVHVAIVLHVSTSG